MNTSAGTFNTKLSIFECVITVIHLVHLWQIAVTFMLLGLRNHLTFAESNKCDCKVTLEKQWKRTLARTCHHISKFRLCQFLAKPVLTLNPFAFKISFSGIFDKI